MTVTFVYCSAMSMPGRYAAEPPRASPILLRPARSGRARALTTHDGHRMMWHDGDSIGTSTYVARYLDTPLTIIVLSNQTRLEAEKLERKLTAHYLSAPER